MRSPTISHADGECSPCRAAALVQCRSRIAAPAIARRCLHDRRCSPIRIVSAARPDPVVRATAPDLLASTMEECAIMDYADQRSAVAVTPSTLFGLDDRIPRAAPGATGVDRKLRRRSVPGSRCRYAEPGETVLLLPWTHLDVDTPYRAGGPIFVREAARPRVFSNTIPEQQRSRLLSVRATSDGDADRRSPPRMRQMTEHCRTGRSLPCATPSAAPC